MEMETLVQLDPTKVLAEDNVRFGLKSIKVDNLGEDILEQGGVLQPVEVVALKPAVNGFTHRLTSGFYRHAAVLKLNAEQNAGLTLPAIVRETNEAERLRHQISENVKRESMSLMDEAVAMDKLIKSGSTPAEVRRIFSRPGGRKGIAIQPLSNAMLNIMLRFLELPKAIQDKIHDGRIGVAAAYEIGKVPPDKRAAVLARAEADRIAQIDREESDEKKYLAAESKLAKAQADEAEATGKVAEAKAAIEAAAARVKEKELELKKVQKEPYLELDKAGQKAMMERINAAIADVKAAEKLDKDAKNALAKILKVANAAAESAEKQKETLESARKAVKSNKKATNRTDAAVGPQDVKKAAKAEGVDTGLVALSLSDIRESTKDVMKQTDYPKVATVAKLFKEMMDGKWTPKELAGELAFLTGERALAVARPAAVPAAKPAAAPAKVNAAKPAAK